MRRLRRAAVAMALALAYAPARATECTEPTPECLDALKRHVVRSQVYWESALAKPWQQRIGPAPQEVVDYITRDNIMRGLPNRPRPSGLPAEFMRDVEEALSELPPAVVRRLEDKLAGIWFAVDFGGTGFTDAVADAAGSERFGFIVLDSTILSLRAANAWATWKENSPFSPEEGYRLMAEIEEPRANNRKNAIQYILLHEIGHVLSIGEKLHPSWTLQPREVRNAGEYEYFAQSWAAPEGSDRYASLFDERFPHREQVVYYFGARLSLQQAVEVYGALEATDFPTLYAATSPGDDWAEGFASYVHTVLLNKPFRVRIFRTGELIGDYGACWTEPRCTQKRKIIERFIGLESGAH